MLRPHPRGMGSSVSGVVSHPDQYSNFHVGTLTPVERTPVDQRQNLEREGLLGFCLQENLISYTLVGPHNPTIPVPDRKQKFNLNHIKFTFSFWDVTEGCPHTQGGPGTENPCTGHPSTTGLNESGIEPLEQMALYL